MQKLSDLEKIVRDPAHELAGLLVVVERERKLLKVRKDLGSHVVFHLRAHDVTYIGYVVVREKLDDNEAYQDETQMDDPLLRSRLEIDDVRMTRAIAEATIAKNISRRNVPMKGL